MHSNPSCAISQLGSSSFIFSPSHIAYTILGNIAVSFLAPNPSILVLNTNSCTSLPSQEVSVPIPIVVKGVCPFTVEREFISYSNPCIACFTDSLVKSQLYSYANGYFSFNSILEYSIFPLSIISFIVASSTLSTYFKPLVKCFLKLFLIYGTKALSKYGIEHPPYVLDETEAIICTICPTATSTEFGSNIFAFPMLQPPFNILSICTNSQLVSLNRR